MTLLAFRRLPVRRLPAFPSVRTTAFLATSVLFGLGIFPVASVAQAVPAPPGKPIQLNVDLTDAPRHLLHAHMAIPVTAGQLTLEYPEWIPGDHRPTGPIDNLAGVFVRANGQELAWRRDSVDMYAIHLDVPAGVSQIDVSLDFLAVPGATGSD